MVLLTREVVTRGKNHEKRANQKWGKEILEKKALDGQKEPG